MKKAAHYERFVEAFALSKAERAKLDQLGFVVVPAREAGGAGPVDVYYRVFAADLPVFVTADSVLHAWHRSYDTLLEATERGELVELLTELLAAVEDAIDGAEAGAEDARLYVQVARVLLRDERNSPPSGGESGTDSPRPSATLGAANSARPPSEAVDAFVEAAYAERQETIDLMGQPVQIDFSQFRPRGHYAGAPGLAGYFRAMMWLGLVDLRLYDPRFDVTRSESAARSLVSALSRSGRQASYQHLERFYRAHVGRPNALTPRDLSAIYATAGAPNCAGQSASGVDLTPQYLSASSSPDSPGVSMRLVPQRFAYDAWVTAKLTAPRLPIVHHVSPETGVYEVSARLMATPYEVAFALGSDRALLPLMGESGQRYAVNLPQFLAATRTTVQESPPVALDATLYNRWLEGLMAVAKTDVRPELPRVLQTAAWHDRKLETVLASWAELRHDTVLMVEQSVGRLGCQYPQGYVEPVPDLYRQLARAASDLAALYPGEKPEASHRARRVKAWAKHFGEVMQRLARLAEQQLRGEPMKAADLAFMNQTVDQQVEQVYLGDRAYDGWYPALFFSSHWVSPAESRRGRGGRQNPHVEGGRSKPIVIDVHTDAQNERVLQAGTGHPELLVVAIDQGGDVSVYGGAVSSFFTFERPSSSRMTDGEWRDAIRKHALPGRPEFARGYRAE